MRKLLLVVLLLFVACPAGAREIAGVTVEEQVVAGDGTVLHLNGVGIRKKLFFKIYIAQLYLQNTANEGAKVIESEGVKRVVMHFLYDNVGKEKLVAAWNDGFSANNSAAKLASLQSRIDAFNAMFEMDAVRGDVVVFEYQSGKGTSVTVNQEPRGVIEGKDFNDALLSIWLGDVPVTSDLRKEMLGL